MALIVKDRIKEVTTTTGTGTVTLAGASTGFRSFADIGNANTTYYCISGGSQFEVGIGTYTASGTTLSRDTVLSNSLGTTAKIDFSAGSKDVFVTYPASTSVTNPNPTDIIVNGITVGRGDGNVATNTAFGNDAIGSPYITSTNINNVGIGYNALNTIGSGVATLTINNGGSGYAVDDDLYQIQLIYVSGTPVLAGGVLPTIQFAISGGVVTAINSIVNNGYGFLDTTTVFTIPSAPFGGGSGFTCQIASLMSATNNTALGYNSGNTQTIRSNSVYIGANATGGGDNEIVIGANATGGGDNTVTIGNASTTTTTLRGSVSFSSLLSANGGLNATGAITLSGSSASNIAIGSNVTSGTIIVGRTTGTGTITLGQSTAAQTVNIATGTTAASTTKAINIGNAGNATSTTNIAIGSATGTSTTTINGSLKSTNLTALTNDLTLSAISTGAIKFNTLNGEQVRISDATVTGQYTSFSRNAGANTQLIGAMGTANLGLYATGGGVIRFFTASNLSQEQFNIASTASAVNYVQVTGGATTKAVFLSAQGETNTSLGITTKGTGAIDLAAGTGGVNISNGGTVTGVTRTNIGSGYTSIPSVAVSAPTTTGGVQATASANMFLLTQTIVSGGTGYTVGDVLTIAGGTGTPATLTVSTVSSGVITGVTGTTSGLYSATPTNPVSVTGGSGSGATFNLTYGVNTLTITNAGSGYIEQPTVTFSGGGGSGAAAYAVVGGTTTLRGLGNTFSINTPMGESVRIGDGLAQQTGYLFLQGSSSTSGGSYVTAQTGNLYLSANASGNSIQFFTTNTRQLQIAHTPSAVNYVQVTGGTTVTKTVSVIANGQDTDVDLALTPRGAGNVKFGTYTASILTPTGYIEVKDSGGTVRRLLVG
jgi:hypothetical protein